MKILADENGEMVKMKRTWLMYVQMFLPWPVMSVIWGLVFSNVVVGVIVGAVIGLIITFFSASAISRAQTVERRSEIIYAAGALWLPPAIWLGAIGLVVLAVKLIFF